MTISPRTMHSTARAASMAAAAVCAWRKFLAIIPEEGAGR